MKETKITVHTGFKIGRVDPRIFGGFLEHLGRAVYQGIYEPESIHADEHGFRKDVLQTIERMNIPLVRYPGGNFASGYHWQDGIGPRESRPCNYDLAWRSIEPNQFGTDEFIRLCRKMKWEPYIAVNLGTGTPEEARNWVEYCNIPPGTTYSNMRKANGNDAPFKITYWGLGNEMDGPWQIGHGPVKNYAVRALQAAKLMKDLDKSIQLIVCGSSSSKMESFPDWDYEVLSYLGDHIDYISLHRYMGNNNHDTPAYLAETRSIDNQIETIDALCRYMQTKHRSKKRVYLCFDEWNVWYKNQTVDGSGEFAPHLLEEIYNLEDALLVAGFLNSFIRHADAVKIANIAQIVNVIAPLITRGDDLLIQSTFYPFIMFSGRAEGFSLRLKIDGPGYMTEEFGEVEYIDSSAVLGDGCLHIFACNRHLTEEAEVIISIADGELVSLENGELLCGPGPEAANSFEQPDLLKSIPFTEVQFPGGNARFKIPPLGIVALTLSLK
ncbi:MAG: alpha-N-arabinofuranosidase [Spirochaetales bacterium]|nr:alpha-N-arabinofuranosidase [Spirochaetales bacterium]